MLSVEALGMEGSRSKEAQDEMWQWPGKGRGYSLSLATEWTLTTMVVTALGIHTGRSPMAGSEQLMRG